MSYAWEVSGQNLLLGEEARGWGWGGTLHHAGAFRCLSRSQGTGRPGRRKITRAGSFGSPTPAPPGKASALPRGPRQTGRQTCREATRLQ